MGAITTSLGGGLGDSANQSIAINSTSYIVSDFQLSTTSTYVSGGFDSLGNPYITRPIAVIDVTVRVGSSGSSNIAIKPIFKTSSLTGTFVNTTPLFFTGLLGVNGDGSTSTESTYIYKAFANTSTVYYGLQGFATGTIEYGNGGSSGGIILQRFNGRETVGAGTLSSSTKLSGSVTQASIPSAPGSFSFTSIPTDTTIYLAWNPPADDGMQSPAAYSASNIKGYRINYRNDPEEIWKVLVANTGSNATTATVTGLSPSTYYELQFAALNAVTDAHNTSYSSITAHVGSLGPVGSFTTAVSTNDARIWDGSTFKKSIIKIWDGAAWIQYPNVRAKVWNGTVFKDLVLDS
jgi:hypothetical protein